jgi:hypothetical protein
MVTIAASHPVINTDDNFLITNGWTEPELFTNPVEAPMGTAKAEPRLLHPRPIVLRWNRREYVIAPGETKQVPFDAMRVMFGDPRSVTGQEQRFAAEDGRVGLIPRREAEIARLSIVWGLYQQGMSLLPDYPAIKHIKITTVGLGTDVPPQLIHTPATDPTGQLALYGHPEVEPNRADFLAVVEQNELKTKQLEDKLARVTALLEEKGIVAEVPESTSEADEGLQRFGENGQLEDLEKDNPRFP